MEKVDYELIAKNGWGPECVPRLQIAVYVMCGGGFLGRSAAEQPADFYLDDRVSRRPYKGAEILQAVKTLAAIAKASGMNPYHLPEMPNFHNCGIW
jgi:hypothetical protein